MRNANPFFFFHDKSLSGIKSLKLTRFSNSEFYIGCSNWAISYDMYVRVKTRLIKGK